MSFVTGIGSPNLTYQVVRTPSPSFPWPPDPNSTEYGERCPCEHCVGRLVGDTVDAIRNEADQIQLTMRSNEDTHQLRYLESARGVIFREAQLLGYGFRRDNLIDVYEGPGRRVAVRYDDSFEEVEEVSVSVRVMGSPVSYPRGTRMDRSRPYPSREHRHLVSAR